MGQSFMKLVPDKLPGLLSIFSKEIEEIADRERSEHNKDKQKIIQECYDKYFKDAADKPWEYDDFYQKICETVQEINMKLNSTQFRVPDTEKLKEVYQTHCDKKGTQLTKEEFQKMLQEVLLHSGFTGFGSKDVFFLIFGIPAAALLIKQRVAPKAMPNDFFIPGVTSATVFLLAKLNKL